MHMESGWSRDQGWKQLCPVAGVAEGLGGRARTLEQVRVAAVSMLGRRFAVY